MVLVENGYWFPNGIAVKHSEDNKPELLIVAETPKKTLWAFDITAPGAVEKKRIWGKIPGHVVNSDSINREISSYCKLVYSAILPIRTSYWHEFTMEGLRLPIARCLPSNFGQIFYQNKFACQVGACHTGPCQYMYLPTAVKSTRSRKTVMYTPFK